MSNEEQRMARNWVILSDGWINMDHVAAVDIDDEGDVVLRFKQPLRNQHGSEEWFRVYPGHTPDSNNITGWLKFRTLDPVNAHEGIYPQTEDS